MTTEIHGVTLIIDGLTKNEAAKILLDKEKSLRYVLNKIVKNIGMNKLSRTRCYRVKDEDDKNGVSSHIMIKESHINVHTWPVLGYFHMELSSCKQINEQKVLDILDKLLKDWTILSLQFCKWGNYPSISRELRNDWKARVIEKKC